jgi:hypothetical protein
MEIYKKILALQSDMKAVTKGQDNPFFHSKYFDVNSVIFALKPLLTKHGLVVLQPLSMKDGMSGIETVIADSETGESMSWFTPLPENPDPQKMGAIITYFRRYALTSMLLIQGEEDDDANSASEKTSKPVKVTYDESSEGSKTCPKCGKAHKGKYPKCLSCWQADNKKS